MTTPGEDYPIGAQPTLAALNTMLTADATAMADVMTGVLKRWRYMQHVGAAGLEGPPWNLPQAKAAEMYEDFTLLATLALTYYGQATIPAATDFDDALAEVRGGQ